MMAISVPAGTPIKVALASEVRVKTVGQANSCQDDRCVYGFDKLLIPAGTEAMERSWRLTAFRKR